MTARVGRQGGNGKYDARLMAAIDELNRAQIDWRWKDLAERVDMSEQGVIGSVLRLRAYGLVGERMCTVLKPKLVVLPVLETKAAE